jgi:hypothetical protein
MNRCYYSVQINRLVRVMETGFDPLEAGTEFLVAFRKILKSDCWLRHVCLSARNNSAPTGRILIKFDT